MVVLAGRESGATEKSATGGVAARPTCVDPGWLDIYSREQEQIRKGCHYILKN